MLQRAFETLLDLADQGHYGKGLIATEWVNHQNLGVPPEQVRAKTMSDHKP